MKEIALPSYTCSRCSYVWTPRQVQRPVACPHCKSRRWHDAAPAIQVDCRSCGERMWREERNTKPDAIVVYTCQKCGTATTRLSAHNPYAPEQADFEHRPAVGEWR